MQKNILIIDNDLKVCKKLKYGIAATGHHAYYCLTSREGLIHFMKGHYNFVILELYLEGISGRELIPILRSRETIPILVISSSNEVQDKLDTFALGADDYMIKPLDVKEVIARIKVLGRHFDSQKEAEPEHSVLFCNDFTIDLNYMTAFLKGKKLDLTRKEFKLLYYLISNRGQVVSKEQIYQYVWQEEPFNVANSVMCQIYNLRKKIEENPAAPKFIQTVWGFGYRFLAN